MNGDGHDEVLELHDAELLSIEIREGGARIQVWYELDTLEGGKCVTLSLGGPRALTLLDWTEGTERLSVSDGGFSSTQGSSHSRNRAFSPAGISRESDFDTSAGPLSLRVFGIAVASHQLHTTREMETRSPVPTTEGLPLSLAALREIEAPEFLALALDLVRATVGVTVKGKSRGRAGRLEMRGVYAGRISAMVDPEEPRLLGHISVVDASRAAQELRLLGSAVNLRVEGSDWQMVFIEDRA